MGLSYDDNVFINCPFDDEYKPTFDAIVFAVHDAGFVARCSREVDDASRFRLAEIMRIISECRYGVHDISRTGLDRKHKLPRFNMPFELGIFLGCKRFGGAPDDGKTCLVLDRTRYRYQKFLSDIAGQDIKSHGNSPNKAVSQVRKFLRTESGRVNIPGEARIWNRFKQFEKELPLICKKSSIAIRELTYLDYQYFVVEWLKVNPL
jgi:hypothetical protein